MIRFVVIAFLFFPLSVFAEVYKCVHDGVTEYQQKPCSVGAVDYVSMKKVELPVVVRRGSGGVYNVAGSVNGVPENFIIDTGAGQTSLSSDVAYRLGVRSCNATVRTKTANGVGKNCPAVVSSISIAGLQFYNVTVLLALGMAKDSLIGNDLLSKLKVSQENGVLTLSR